MKLPAAAIGALLALAAALLATAQSPAATLAVAPASSATTAGASVAVDVTVANVAASPGMGGYDVRIAFNPAVVRMDSLTDAGLLPGAICLAAIIDNTTGTARAGCQPLFGLGGFSTTSPVALLHASFTALAAGTSQVDLTGSALKDPGGAQLAVTLSNGTIEVTALASQPSPTPARSSTPPSATASATPTVAASATAMPSPTAAVAAAATTTVPPEVLATIIASVLQAPAAGTGSGSGGFPWPLPVAGAAVAGVAAVGGALVLARRARVRR